MAKIIDGKAHAAAIRAGLKERIVQSSKHYGIAQPPHFSVVLAGNNPASLTYIRGKKSACEDVGINFTLHSLPETISQDEVLALIDKLNADAGTNGILVQMPLPPQLDKYTIMSRINPLKDVDCLNPHNIGLATAGIGKIHPCTPSGIVDLLNLEGIPIAGKHAVIVGRSDVVGKPLAFLLLAQDATVTVCHSRTENLLDICRQADILVAAIGHKPKYITQEYIKPGAVIIDVGINRLSPDSKKVYGDVDFENCLEKASYITPVPGGVGPMTVAKLVENCVKAWEIQHE